MSEQTTPNPAERRTHPTVHEIEHIKDPKRLAEIVLNTLDLTFDYELLHIDVDTINQLMSNPAENWDQIRKEVKDTTDNASQLEPQLETINHALTIVAYYPNEGLPVSRAGEPERTIVDRRGIDQLFLEKDIRFKRPTEETNQILRTSENIAIEKKLRETEDEAVYQDPVRGLALVISRLQHDPLSARWTIAKGWGNRFLSDLPAFDPAANFMLDRLVLGINDTRKYLEYSRNALAEFKEGKRLPTPDEVKKIDTGGTQAVFTYLDTFAPQTPKQITKS